MITPIIFRVDANNKIGTGHLMRLLSLAQEVSKGSVVIFVTRCDFKNLLNKIKANGIFVHRLTHMPGTFKDWQETEVVCKKYNAKWVVLDGYHFTSDYQERIIKSGFKLLLFDDMAQLPFYHSNIIVNQNLHSFGLTYKCNKQTLLLFGQKYVVLRDEFSKYNGKRHLIRKKANHLLIAMGGVDPDNNSSAILKEIERMDIPKLNINVVIGSSNRNEASLLKIARKSFHSISILKNVNYMADLMDHTDCAITSGGTTVWELAFMGVPSIVTITSKIEEYLINGLKKFKIFIPIDRIKSMNRSELQNHIYNLINDKPGRVKMSRKAQKLIDGKGSLRIVRAINSK